MAQPGEHNVLIVAAGKWAYHCFWSYAAYVCQADRSFRHDVDRLGYYAHGAIQAEFPTILARRSHVEFTPDNVRRLRATGYHQDAAFATVIERMLADGRDQVPGQVFLLSGPDDPQTLRIAEPIRNDTRSATGRVTAWTQGQRYVSEAALRACPKTASQLNAPLAVLDAGGHA